MHLSLVVRFGSLMLAGLACAGCGATVPQAAPAGSDAGEETSTTAPTKDAAVADSAPELYPAEAPPTPPQVVSQGGPVLASPKIVPVFFAGDDPTTVASLTDFANKIGQTQYWAAITTEYGVGPATAVAPIQLTAADTPPATLYDSQIQSWITAKLNANDPAWPAPDANTVYVLFYPAGVTISLNNAPPDAGATDAAAGDGGFNPGGGGNESCTGFGGYHENVNLDSNHNGMNVAIAVLPRCDGYDGLSAMDALTSATSHELIEASTDPYPYTTPAYIQVDNAHLYWQRILGGSEIGDMCAQFQTSFTKFAELPLYEVQRCWSDKAARTGQEPCVPALPGEVYFNSAPVLDMVPMTFEGQTIQALGEQLAVGASKTIELELFSTGPMPDWTISAQDTASLEGQPAQLQFTFDKTTGNNGDKIQMTVKVLTAGRRNSETFIITSTSGSQQNIWIGVIVS
jgi:hypothetical protein